MRVIIIEDEHAAAENLKAIVKEFLPDIKIMAVLESVEESILWLNNNKHPDLGFFDIQLADGSSFEIFKKTDIRFPVVFTTAYNEYAIQAFRVNSVDYILKPVNQEDVKKAIHKFIDFSNINLSYGNNLLGLIENIKTDSKERKYKKAFLVHYKDKLIPVNINEVAYFYIDSGTVYAYTTKKQKYILEQKLDIIENQINPDDFFRANRQFIIARNAVKEVNFYFNGRLSVITNPPAEEKVIISKAKAGRFKSWLNE